MAASRSGRIATALAVYLALLAIAGCGGKSRGTGTAPLPEIASVLVQPERALLERPVDGIIEAVNQATVSAQTSGRVAQILFDVNDFVPAGAVIIRLRGTEQRAGLQQAEADLTEARARNEEAQATFQRMADMNQRRLISKAQ